MRPRKAPVTSRNLCAMAPFHNFPSGRAAGQSLGRCARAARHERAIPILLLAARERSERSRRRQPQGHGAYVHLRPDGLGQVGPDRLSDRRCLAVKARPKWCSTRTAGSRFWFARSGGTYLAAQERCADGFNPLQLPQTAENVEFLKTWLRALVRGAAPLTIREESRSRRGADGDARA